MLLIEPGTGEDVGARLVVGVEGSVGRQRHAGAGHARASDALAVLVQLHEIDNPQRRRIVERPIDARKVEEAVLVGGHLDVAHRLEGGPEQQGERLAFGPDETEDRDLVGHFVGAQAGPKRH